MKKKATLFKRVEENAKFDAVLATLQCNKLN